MLIASGDRPISGSKEKSIGLWMRHLDPDTPQDATAILAIGDAPPPAAMSMLADALADQFHDLDGGVHDG